MNWRQVILLGFVLCAIPLKADAGWRMFERRIGMFVHWGIYAVDGYHEQQRMRQRLGRAEYAERVKGFTAAKFDPDRWIDVAESAGAEYIVFTAKHHDGFCMWDTRTTDFKVTNSPAKRDVLRELADACRRRGMKLGLYYSNPDWNHPNAYNPKSTHQVPPEAGDVPDLEKYREYVKTQIAELLTDYGEIVCLFWDIPTKVPAPEMDEMVRRLQPGIRINDRGWDNVGDYSTPERGLPDGAAFTRPTEACDSVGAQSWGYRANEDYHTLGYLTSAIDRTLARGGNFLLNVGPKADGTIPPESAALMAGVGSWYRKVRESYGGVETVTGLVADARCIVTKRGSTLYLHYADGLDATGVDLKPMKNRPKSVTLLNTGAPLEFAVETLPRNWDGAGESLHLRGIPADALAGEGVVIRLDGDRTGRLSVTALNPECMSGGAGLCVIFRTPEGRTFMFDTANGDWCHGAKVKNNGRDIVAPWLRAHGIGEIDGLVVSHPHGDHFGGFIWMKDNFPIRRLWDNGFVMSEAFSRHYQGEIGLYCRLRDEWSKSHPGCYGVVLQGDKLDFGSPKLDVEVVWPPRTYVPVLENDKRMKGDGPEHHLQNANAIALQVTYGKVKFFIVGDIQDDYLKAVMIPGIPKEKWACDIAFLPSHGIHTTDEELELMNPKVAIADIGNMPWMYDAVRRAHGFCARHGIPLYASNERGHITVTTDGETFDITCDETGLVPKDKIDWIVKDVVGIRPDVLFVTPGRTASGVVKAFPGTGCYDLEYNLRPNADGSARLDLRVLTRPACTLHVAVRRSNGTVVTKRVSLNPTATVLIAPGGDAGLSMEMLK